MKKRRSFIFAKNKISAPRVRFKTYLYLFMAFLYLTTLITMQSHINYHHFQVVRVMGIKFWFDNEKPQIVYQKMIKIPLTPSLNANKIFLLNICFLFLLTKLINCKTNGNAALIANKYWNQFKWCRGRMLSINCYYTVLV